MTGLTKTKAFLKLLSLSNLANSMGKQKSYDLVDDGRVILIISRQSVQVPGLTLLNPGSCFNQFLLSNIMDTSLPTFRYRAESVCSSPVRAGCCCCLFVQFSESSCLASVTDLLIPANTKHHTMETCRWPSPSSQYQISVKLTSS